MKEFAMEHPLIVFILGWVAFDAVIEIVKALAS